MRSQDELLRIVLAQNRLLSEHPRLGYNYYLRAKAYAALNKNAEALQDYELAIRFGSAFFLSQLYQDRGDLYFRYNRKQLAAADYARSIFNHSRFLQAPVASKKEVAYDLILQFSEAQQSLLRVMAQDKHTLLGELMWQQRGMRAPSLDRGILKQIADDEAAYQAREKQRTNPRATWSYFAPAQRVAAPPDNTQILEDNTFKL